jgi:hypothetical protein
MNKEAINAEKIREFFNDIVKGDFATVKNKLSSGMNVNTQASDGGKAPLHVACHVGSKIMLRILLEAKADVHIKTNAGFMPIHVAAQNGHMDIIAELVSAGAKFNEFTGEAGTTPLHEAAARGHKNAVLKLLELGADPSLKDARYNLTAANLAHEKMHIEVRDILVNAMTYQQQFVQNINFILFNWMRGFNQNSNEFKFFKELSTNIKGKEEGDEVFRILRTAITSHEYKALKPKIEAVHKLFVANMNQYNADKTAGQKKDQAQVLPKTTPVNDSTYHDLREKHANRLSNPKDTSNPESPTCKPSK